MVRRVVALNPKARELSIKVVYYGPGLGGKTSSLEHLHRTTEPERRGKLLSLATPVDRTLFFDFLPLRPLLAPLGARTDQPPNVRLQLFTVPGQVYFNATRKLVLTGADGVVFVADSQPERLDANLESLENLRDNLREHGRDLARNAARERGSSDGHGCQRCAPGDPPGHRPPRDGSAGCARAAGSGHAAAVPHDFPPVC